MPFKSAAEASLVGSIGGFTLRATHDPKAYTRTARAVFLNSFVERVDPDRVLSEAERMARAEALRSAHFKRLALKSVQSRTRRTSRKRKNATEPTSVAIQEVPLSGSSTQQSRLG